MTTFLVTILDDLWSEALPEVRKQTSPPLDLEARRALFASLRDVYGDLNDAERLRKVSILAGRKITSMSRYGDMTMADARRVLDILHTFIDR